MYKKMNIWGLCFCLMTFLFMVSCGDNNDNTPEATADPVTISGIAGTGSTSTSAAKADFFKAANQAVAANSVIPNGVLTIFDKLGKVLGTGTTDANGLFSIDVIPGLNYFLQIVSEDGATAVRAYLANANAGTPDVIVNAFSSTLVFAMEQRLGATFTNPTSGGFTGSGLPATVDQILVAAGFPALVAQVQADLANGNVANGLASAQAALTALLEGLPALPTGGTGGGGTIAITVGSGLTPAYTFDGGAVNSLSVMRTSAPTVVVWGITTPLSDGITSPLTHNTVGNGVVQTFSTETTLTAGVEYRVVVTRTDGSTGFTSFTPSAGGTGGGTGGTTPPIFTGSLTFSGSGALKLPNGSDPFTFLPISANGDALSNPEWTMGKVADPNSGFILLDTPRKLHSNKLGLVRVVARGGATWVLADLANGVAGTVVSINGNVLSFTFTDVQLPEFATGSSTLVINGTITMSLIPDSSATSPDLGSLALTANGSPLDGISFTPVKVTKKTDVHPQFGGTFELTYLYSPQAGDLHKLNIKQGTGSPIPALNKTVISYSVVLNGGLGQPTPGIVRVLDSSDFSIGANSLVFTDFGLSGLTLNGTLTIPPEDGVLQ